MCCKTEEALTKITVPYRTKLDCALRLRLVIPALTTVQAETMLRTDGNTMQALRRHAFSLTLQVSYRAETIRSY